MVLCGIVQHLLYQITAKTLNDALTWVHIILTEIGVVGSTVLLGIAGYIGGRLVLENQPISVIHDSVIGYALPTTVLVGVAVVGALLAIINSRLHRHVTAQVFLCYVLAWSKNS